MATSNHSFNFGNGSSFPQSQHQGNLSTMKSHQTSYSSSPLLNLHQQSLPTNPASLLSNYTAQSHTTASSTSSSSLGASGSIVSQSTYSIASVQNNGTSTAPSFDSTSSSSVSFAGFPDFANFNAPLAESSMRHQLSVQHHQHVPQLPGQLQPLQQQQQQHASIRELSATPPKMISNGNGNNDEAGHESGASSSRASNQQSETNTNSSNRRTSTSRPKKTRRLSSTAGDDSVNGSPGPESRDEGEEGKGGKGKKSRKSATGSNNAAALDSDGTGDGGDQKPKLKRIHQACIQCGAKKQKCSGGHPCENCNSQGFVCAYKESKKRGPPKGSKRQRKMTGDSSTPAPVAREKSSKKDRVIVIDTKKQIEESRTEDIDAKPSPHMSTASLRASSHGTSAQTPNSQNKSLPGPLSASSTTAPNSLFPHHPHQQQHQQQTISPSPVNAFSQLASIEHNIHSSHQPISPHVESRMSIQHPNPNPLPSYEFGYPHIEHPVELPSVENRIPDQTLYGMQSLGLLYNVPDNSVQHNPSTISHSSSSTIPLTFSQSHHQQAPAVTVTAAAPLRPLNDSSLYREAPEHVTVIEGGETPDGRMLLMENNQRAEGSSKSGESYSHRHHQDVTEAYRGASSGIPSLHAHRHHSDDGPMNGGKRTRSLSGAARPRHADLYANIRNTKGSHSLRYGDSLRTHSGDDDVFEDEDRDLFTLPPIRLSSTRSQGNGISSPNFPLLIPQGLFDRLISYYFAISHHSCPIIYKPDIDIANIQNQLAQLLLDGMCCLAARFLENDDLTTYLPHLRGAGAARLKLAREQIEQHYYDRARKQLQEDDYRSSIPTVQALLLLSKRDTGCGRMLHCWHLIGAATRMVIDLGMHRKAALVLRAKDTTYGQIETRRRTFWQAYIMDKHTAASLGRPVFLREEDIDVLLPSEVAPDEFERWVGRYPVGLPHPENRAISTHNAFARLSIILQSVINDLYSTRARKWNFEMNPVTGEIACYTVLRELHSQLESWKSSLPNHLQWTPASQLSPPPPHQLLLHAFYHTCMLLLFRPVIPVSNQLIGDDKHGMPRPHDVCTQAADAVMQIMAVYESTYGLKRISSSTAVYYIFTAATIYVGNSSSLDTLIAQQANAGLQKCTDLLEHLSETCSTASQHRQILLDISRLSSTKLRSRDDAENLLSSRVPSQAPAHPTKSAKTAATQTVGDTGNNAGPLVKLEDPTPVQQNTVANLLNATGGHAINTTTAVQPQSMLNTNLPHLAQQTVISGQGHVNGGGATYPFQQDHLQPSHNNFDNAFINPHQQASTFLGASGGFDSGFNFNNPAFSMPFASNPSTNQADLAFWREMPIGEDANEWGFFTDQYANTLLSSLPSFPDTYSSQM